MDTVFCTLRLRPILHCEGCEPMPTIWLYDLGCPVYSIVATHSRNASGMDLKDRNGNSIDLNTSLLEYFCVNGPDIWCHFSRDEDADAVKTEYERARKDPGFRPVILKRVGVEKVTSHLIPEPPSTIYFERHQHLAHYIQFMLEQKGYGTRKVELKLWDFSTPPDDYTAIHSISNNGVGMLVTLGEPDDMEIRIADGVRLTIDKSHFHAIKNGIGLSRTAVDELREFLDTLDPQNDRNRPVSEANLTSTELWNRVNNDLTTIRTRLPPGSARRLRELLSSPNTNTTYIIQQPHQAQQSIFGTMVQLGRQINAWVQAKFRAIAGIEWLGICIFAFCFEILKVCSRRNTFYGSMVVWSFTGTKIFFCELKRIGIFNIEEYCLAHVYPVVHSVDAVNRQPAPLRQAAADEIQGTAPNYDLIVNNLIVRPYIYQQVAICISSILPWVMRSWRDLVNHRREEVLKLVKARIAEEKEKLVAESKAEAINESEKRGQDISEIE